MAFAQDSEFEVAVTAGTSAEGKAGLEVLGAVIGLGARAEHSSAKASTVRFKLPLALPAPEK
jgi:hypothetical protein